MTAGAERVAAPLGSEAGAARSIAPPAGGWWLAVSTSGPDWSLWLGRSSAAQPPFADADQRCLLGVRGQPRDLVGVMAELLASRGLAVTDLAGLVVDSGPGSFTSLRMGLAAVRALAWAQALPVATVCSLDAMAAQALHGGASPRLACVLPARRGWWYVATYQADLHNLAPNLATVLASRETAQVATAHLARHLTQRLGDRDWTGLGPLDPADRRELGAGDWVADAGPRAAWMAYVASQLPNWTTAQLAVPEYLAVSEAEAAAATAIPETASDAISQFSL